MSAISAAGYEALINKIRSSMEDATNDLNSKMQALENDFGGIPFVGGAVKGKLQDAQHMFDQAMSNLDELLQVCEVPADIWKSGATWNTIAENSGNYANQINDLVQKYQQEWQGLAGGKYSTAISDQSPAVYAIESMAQTMSNAASGIGQNGFGFLISIGSILSGLIIALASLDTGPGAIAGIVIAVITFVGGLAGALYTLKVGMESSIRNLEQLSQPNQSFPDGKWPPSAN